MVLPAPAGEVDPALIQPGLADDPFDDVWNYAGLVRTTKRLEKGKADLEYLEHHR